MEDFTITFMLSGQGSQHFHMGRELYDRHPVFRRWMREGDRLLREIAGRSLLDALYNEKCKRSDPFDDLALTSPALYTLEYALAKTLAHHGIVPDRLVGLSLGEFASLAIAGCFTFEEGLRAVARQPEVFSACPRGGMIGVLAGAEAVARELAVPHEVIAVNGENHCVLAAPGENIGEITSALKAAKILHQVLPVPLAFHSRWIDPAREAFLSRFAGMHVPVPQIPVLPGRNASVADGGNAELLWGAVRDPMDLPSVINRLEAESNPPALYIDIGPSGTLAGLVRGQLGAEHAARVHQIFSPFGNEERALNALLQNLQSTITS